MSTREERERWRNSAFHATFGVFVFIGISLAVAGFIERGMKAFGADMAYDETDDVANHTRSNLALRTDHGTGCQYLATSLGGITPRLGPDGKQICGDPA